MLLGTLRPQLRPELIRPLIRLAVGGRYQREAGDVRVGFQYLDGSSLSLVAFPTLTSRRPNKERATWPGGPPLSGPPAGEPLE